MKIATTKTTVANLLALLQDADPTEEVSFGRTNPKTPAPCWCGCGGTTKSKFVPGHDSKFHGLAKKVARGQADHADALIGLAHDEARAAFEAHVAAEKPLHEAREEAKAAKKATREAEKAAKKPQKSTGGLVLAQASTDTEVEEFFSDVA